MDMFNKICKDIKELKIQGATAVAKEGVKALRYKRDKSSVEKLLSLRPTEPMLKNAVKFVLQDFDNNYQKALEHFEKAEKQITEIGSREISSGIVIFTHCHSSTVTKVLIEAKRQGKKFEVYNTETRPLYQGRKTATELAKAKIPVTHFIDSAGRIALKKADIMIIGADAVISSGKVANKVGSEMFALVAKSYGVPVYCCTNSWKFDAKTILGYKEKIEERSPKEVWGKAPKGIKVSNLAFELISPDLIEAIISELGIYNPLSFVEEVKKKYPWITE